MLDVLSGVSGPAGLFPSLAPSLGSIPVLDLLQWLGFIPAALGSYLLSGRARLSRYAWSLYLVSNVFWFASGVLLGSIPLILQQVWFFVTSVRGIYRWREPATSAAGDT